MYNKQFMSKLTFEQRSKIIPILKDNNTWEKVIQAHKIYLLE